MIKTTDYIELSTTDMHFSTLYGPSERNSYGSLLAVSLWKLKNIVGFMYLFPIGFEIFSE